MDSYPDQLRCFRESAALLPLSLWRRIGATGRDTLDYLHRRLSQSIKNLPDGAGTHALQLDATGRLQADLLVYRRGDGADMLSPADAAESAFELLEKYTLVDDVALARRWESESIIAIAGPRAEDALRRAAGSGDSPDGADRAIRDIEIAGVACTIFRDPRWPVPFFRLAFERENVERVCDALLDVCRAIGGGTIGAETCDFMRLEHGVTQFGIDTEAGTIPLEAALYDAIDFDKGCFPGQEFLARINNLGHPAHRLAKLEIKGEHVINAGAAILTERAESQEVSDEELRAGRVSSSRTLPGARRTVALGYLKWRFHETTEAAVATPEGLLTAKVTPLGPARDMSGAKRTV